jgi:hypothetical protein
MPVLVSIHVEGCICYVHTVHELIVVMNHTRKNFFFGLSLSMLDNSLDIAQYVWAISH